MNEMVSQLRQELLQELEDNILDFWMKRMPDDEHGGFLGHLDFNGRPDPAAPKGAILNARILWTFSAAFRLLKKDGYLEMAERAFVYFRDHFIDRVHGGVFWELDHRGNPTGTRKQVYALAFAVYGLSEYYMATGSEEALRLAVEQYRTIEASSFDIARNGYFEAFSRDWKPVDDLRLSERDQNENKTMNTHLHILEAYTSLYRAWKDPGLAKQLRNLVELFLERFVNDAWHLDLFFDDDWHLKSDFISYGHDIEAAWLLHEAAQVLDDAGLSGVTGPAAVSIADVNMEGRDRDGGLFYEYFPAEDRRDTDKHWWPQAESLVGQFNAWELTGDEKYLVNAVSSWEFIKRFLVDREQGEWHWSVNREGMPVETEEKAGFWKCPYHNSRACMEIIMRTGGIPSH